MGHLGLRSLLFVVSTGALIIDHIRFRHGHSNIQGLLKQWFGNFGTTAFNIVIALRLVSEIFVNLYVAELFIGGNDDSSYFMLFWHWVLTLLYAMAGGLKGLYAPTYYNLFYSLYHSSS